MEKFKLSPSVKKIFTAIDLTARILLIVTTIATLGFFSYYGMVCYDCDANLMTLGMFGLLVFIPIIIRYAHHEHFLCIFYCVCSAVGIGLLISWGLGALFFGNGHEGLTTLDFMSLGAPLLLIAFAFLNLLELVTNWSVTDYLKGFLERFNLYVLLGLFLITLICGAFLFFYVFYYAVNLAAHATF